VLAQCCEDDLLFLSERLNLTPRESETLKDIDFELGVTEKVGEDIHHPEIISFKLECAVVKL
jgi:hypothetical protein